MNRVKILDREFDLSIPEEKLLKAVDQVAERINKDLDGKNPLMICVLNGSFMFASDLMKRLTIACEISFVKLSSYSGTGSTGTVKEIIGLNQDIKDRTVVLLEDIVDTGLTIINTVEQVKQMGPADVRVATMLFKPDACKRDVKLDYVGMDIPNDFIVGYGLDYDGYGRNLKDIYTVVE
ncbi:hypoxanthine phosphoribosyltransferase [Carboxylicivirga sp. M1479]|uniref:hypoxanthine phosphoribosyltransferase n=1 Tax=Carboxylicivirga sp. M1479 TaxID=2594476 RepID=UPI001177D2E4|nr:hypoxanthine phosphoribosyltransferase [Carboxylicivirga sp. M1479]TRX72252.1 hypoxanthine phosphoribosyltransferase [Carboxylicivirga sp. M1479]